MPIDAQITPGHRWLERLACSRMGKKVQRECERLYRWWLLRGVASAGESILLFGPVVMLGREKITIGSRVSIAGFLHIWGHGGVIIGDDVLIASHVAISSITHDPATKPFNSKNIGKPVSVGRNVWIGSHAFIGAGVTVGEDSIIGAGAVVLRDVAPGTVVAGVPAKELRKVATSDRGYCEP